MAYRGGHLTATPGLFSFDAIPELLTGAIKKAQTPAGFFVPPTSYNDSQYGAVGPWRVEGDGETVHLPKFKFTIKKGYRTIVVTIKEPDFRIWNVAGVLHQHAVAYRHASYWRVSEEFTQTRRMPMFSDEWNKVEGVLQSIAGSFNFDQSDMQTDYFHYGFTLEVRPDPKLAEGNTQRAERVISELEVAFPDAWAKILAEAAGEAQWVFHQTGSEIGTSRRDELDRAIKRAREGAEAGLTRIEYRADRPGSGWRRVQTSREGLLPYFRREKKVKGGEVIARVGDTAKLRETDPLPTMASALERPWLVEKLTGYDRRSRRYETRETVGGGREPSLEAAIENAGGVMESVR